MGSVTYFVAMAFARNDEGERVAGEVQVAADVRGGGERGPAYGGDVGRRIEFSRLGDPAIGGFQDTVVLREFGEVPSLDQLLYDG